MELLAPAGNTESLVAALRCGADAVYIGGKSFSARQNASNFDTAEIKEAARLCHRYGAALHIAVNTVITDSQTDDFIREIRKYAEFSPDAFIVQDPGAAYIIRNTVPDIPLHASTQMTVHTPGGAEFAKGLGFSRVVISREASRQMISEITSAGLETEIFVHGALCMSVSGQCYMSAMIGSRSANRGLCAQSCRLPFSPVGHPDEHCLSLKDLSLIGHIGEIKALGVTSLKIEGRMKRPEYVAAAVTAYRTAIDGGSPDTEMLKAVFSRNGFTDGYFTGNRKNMFGMRDRDDVMSSSEVLPDLRQLYRKERKVSVLDFDVTVRKDSPVTITASDSDGFSCTVTGAEPEAAVNRAVTAEDISRQLTKLGDTIYSCGRNSINAGEGLSVPASSLNQLRREAVEKLYSMREERKPYQTYSTLSSGKNAEEKRKPCTSPPAVRVRLEKASAVISHDLTAAEYIILPLREIISADIPGTVKEKIIAEPPRFIYDEEKLKKELKYILDHGFRHLMCSNAAYLKTGRELGFVLHGDFGLNVTNRFSAEELAGYGLKDITLSFELKSVQAGNISCSSETGIIAYGKVPLMLTANCPVRNSVGCGRCRHSITDRTGRRFRVMCSEGYAEIFNSEAIYLADKPEAYEKLDFITLFFTDESEKEIKKIFTDYAEGSQAAPQGITRGLYFRGIK
ncbi:U32 family peptidase [Ruminococcus sp. HUN007]|uniref:peptidase U32 family protein n=1 Tax=Ruminococcus sp. HUN007 TaxID=1514668 RepID=UPI0005D17858|nr:U32 family peptidase [Ruminococcus sp. HUN007]